MPAANTDKFIKVASNTGWQLDASGISDASVTSFSLISATSLPTDTAVILTIDRVNSSGVATPSLMERVVGVMSGTTVTSCERGLEGTAQAHAAGAVVEIVISKSNINKLMEGILVEHGQDGKHTFSGLTSKTTPIDADSLPIVDSAASNVLKRLTWANLKANLALNTIPLNAPQGFLINGKIVPSVTSNNLTVALKTLAGTDPSASDPVYCRIGDTVRSITAALSTTSAAGEVAVLNSSSAELATKEIDYFVYLFFKASDSSIKIGFSRYPGGNIASDFGAWNTEKGLYDKSAMGIAASDTGELIGRFAATNSGSASYNWSVPTFTAANLIQRPIYETRLLDWVPTTSASAGTYTTTSLSYAKYKVSGSTVKADIVVSGTTSSTPQNIRASLPFTSARDSFGSGYSTDATATVSEIVFTGAAIYSYLSGFVNYSAGASRVLRASGEIEI